MLLGNTILEPYQRLSLSWIIYLFAYLAGETGFEKNSQRVILQIFVAMTVSFEWVTFLK